MMNWKWPRLTSCLRITLAILLTFMSVNPVSVNAATGFYDLTRDPDDITARKTAVVEDAVWIRIDNGDPDDDATGTGYFNSFLRLQKSDGERGYNSNLDKVLYDELKSFTDAELLSVVPFVEYEGRWYREFQLDINENDDYLVLNRLQIWVTEHENLIGTDFDSDGVHYFTEDQTVKVYDTGDNVLMLSYRGGSGNREYKVLIPAEDFPDMTYVVIYTEMGFPDDAIPEEFGEDFSSNDGFEEWGVKVMTETPPTIDVLKTALVTSVPEPGAWVTYRVDIANSSGMTDPVTINSLTDAIEGGMAYSISGVIFDDMALTVPTTFPFTIQPGMTKTVYFKSYVSGEPRTVNDIVTASGVDDEGTSVSDFDDADVIITDVLPVIELIKTADPLSRDEPGGLFTYTFTVKNLSVEPVMLTKIVDDKIGVLYEWKAGDPEIWIAVGGSYLLPGTFTKTYTDFGTYVNVATAHAKDNEGNTASDTDTQTVKVNDVLPVIELIKTADPLERNEPGGLFTYTFTVKNLSVEPVMLTKIVDDKLGTLYEWEAGDPEIWIAVGGSYLLPGTFTKTYTDFGTYVNIATAEAKDNEGNTASDTDTQTVKINDVLPVIQVVKTAEPLERYEPGGIFTYTFTVYNLSVEPVWLTEVYDDKLGTIYEWVPETDKIWIPVGGSYTLPGTFTKTYTEAGIYPNVVMAYAEDNEGNPASDDDSRSVKVIDVLPQISITKTANKTVIPFSGEDVIFTFVITNHSVEDVEIYSIDDTVFGDLLPEALIAFGDDPIIIGAGQQFTFTITRFISGIAGGEHYNVVTACGMDNEKNQDCDDDDERIKLYWYGFTPGYWKNHAEEWYRTDYMTKDLVRVIFGITNGDVLKSGKLDLNKDNMEDTLMDALNYKGGNDLRGKVQILLRAAVAGLLNESALGDYYPPYEDTDSLIAAVRDAINNGNKGVINTLAGQFDYWNNGIHEFPD